MSAKPLTIKPLIKTRKPSQLTRRAQFVQVQRSGRRVNTPHFVGFVCGNSAEVGARIGITVSRKVSQSSVIRNKLRRRIKEIFRELRPEISPSADFVIIAKSGSTELSFLHLKSELARLFLGRRVHG